MKYVENTQQTPMKNAAINNKNIVRPIYYIVIARGKKSDNGSIINPFNNNQW